MNDDISLTMPLDTELPPANGSADIGIDAFPVIERNPELGPGVMTGSTDVADRVPARSLAVPVRIASLELGASPEEGEAIGEETGEVEFRNWAEERSV